MENYKIYVVGVVADNRVKAIEMITKEEMKDNHLIIESFENDEELLALKCAKRLDDYVEYSKKDW